MSDLKYGQKFCTKCRTLKPLEQFSPSQNLRFGVSAWCKACYSRYSVKYRQNNRSKTKEAVRRYRRKLRKEVIDSMGGKCIYCGCDLLEALQINHKYGGGSQDPVGKGNHLIAAIRFGRRKTDDLELACGVCNVWHKLVSLDGLQDGWTITWSS